MKNFLTVFVNPNIRASHHHSILRQTNNSFYKISGWIFWITEHHHLSPLRLAETISNFINDQIIAALEIRLHTGATHQKRLGDEGTNNKYRYKGNEDYFYYLPNRY